MDLGIGQSEMVESLEGCIETPFLPRMKPRYLRESLSNSHLSMEAKSPFHLIAWRI